MENIAEIYENSKWSEWRKIASEHEQSNFQIIRLYFMKMTMKLYQSDGFLMNYYF
jgi:hypothetical protein